MTRKVLLALWIAPVAAAMASPGFAQTRSHGAGVSWTGGHGGVSWDGGHSYGGGSYGGYPATTPPPPYLSPSLERHAIDLQHRTQVIDPDLRVPGAPHSDPVGGRHRSTRDGH